jgi:hypothetical protein
MTSSKRCINSSDEDEDEDEEPNAVDPSMDFFDFVPSGLVDGDSLPSTQVGPSSLQLVCLMCFHYDL